MAFLLEQNNLELLLLSPCETVGLIFLGLQVCLHLLDMPDFVFLTLSFYLLWLLSENMSLCAQRSGWASFTQHPFSSLEACARQ